VSRKRLSRRLLFGVVAVLSAAVIPMLAGSASAAPADDPQPEAVCPPAPIGYATCLSLRLPGGPSSAAVPYGPADLQAAYQLPSATKGSGQTVAIVDAFDDPTAESDLAFYRSNYGLPSCTTANGCFRKVNQNGGTTYPPFNLGWAEEIALDVEMVSAICPNCHILLVEANDNSFTNLGIAVDRAALMGANTISNSYGGGEFAGEISGDVHYNHPGTAITASSGDDGFGAQYPAASQFVTAVGGTRLVQAPTTRRGWKETAWNGAGSGCSVFEPKPSWQTDPACPRRTIADVSAVADPATGVAVRYNGSWFQFGGTSVSSPIIASVYALAGNAATVNYGSYPYLHTRRNLFDIKKGSNGVCGGTYLCTAMRGYDGPTGLGSPKGIGGF
jgi:subtilase family serine protease